MADKNQDNWEENPVRPAVEKFREIEVLMDDLEELLFSIADRFVPKEQDNQEGR